MEENKNNLNKEEEEKKNDLENISNQDKKESTKKVAVKVTTVIDLDKEVSEERALLREMQEISKSLINRIGSFFKRITDIRTGMDEEQTCNNIRKNVTMKGSNVWLLMSAIMVASLGLNLNSPAVIIGAMLISPLMSPILGVGLSIGINDRSLLSHSLYNFTIAIVVSLITSAIFFMVTPFKDPTPEILARTSPSLLDIGVAFFGGIAGVVSGSRAEQSNAIPGVAIATALLPPLCVSGYGIARLDLAIIFNSFYLFFLNCVFIALATYIIVRLVLRFDFHDYIDLIEQRRTRFMMGLFIVLVSVPSVIFLRNQIKRVQFDTNVSNFVDKKLRDDKKYETIWSINPMDDKKTTLKDSFLLKVTLYGPDPVRQEYIEAYKRDMADFNIKNTRLQVIQINSPKPDQSQTLLAINETRQQDIDKILEQVEIERQRVTTREKAISLLETKLDSINRMKSPLVELEDEVKSLYPELRQVGYAEIQQTDMDTSLLIPTVIVAWDPRKINRTNQRISEKRIGDWVRVRLNLDTIQVLRY